MKNIKVTLLHHTPLYIAANGARTCWNSFDKSDTDDIKHDLFHNTYEDSPTDEEFKTKWGIEPSVTIEIGPKDLALIDRVGNQYHHSSILEHITFNFFIDGISRACLQEWSRHRHMSQSVESTRYTMAKELKTEQSFFKNS